MSRFLSRVDEFLKGSRSSLTPLPELFPPVDLDHIRREARIEERGKENGESELPLSEAETPDAIELDIKGRVQEVENRYLTDYNQQVRLVRDRIFEYAALLDLQSINSDCQKKLGDLKAQADIETNDLYRDSETLKNKAAEIKYFRQDHSLEKRLPSYPDNPVTQIAILMGLVLIEIVINFLLIREAGDMASVAGSAALYSIVNVLIPYKLISSWVRYVHHRDVKLSITGWIGVLFFCAYTLCVNLMMAHYRGVVIDLSAKAEFADPGDQGFILQFLNNQFTAFDNFVSNPFGLQDPFSWYLLLFGVALAVGGLITGYRADDKYPGYGELERRYDKIFTRYIDAIEDTIRHLAQERDEGSLEIENARKTLESEFRRLPNLVANVETLESRCRLALDRLGTDLNMLVKEYRLANQKARSTPAPDYFDEEVALGGLELPQFDVPDVKKPQEAVAALQRFSDRLHEMFDKIIEDLESTRQVLEDDYPFKVR